MMNEFNLTLDSGEEIRLQKLPQEFYLRPPTIVAKELLGKIFVRKTNGKTLAAKIVETEAYDGNVDPAAHSFVGKTKRNATMFEKGGLLYVYLIYGMYYCANIVTGYEGEGHAVLLRAMQPLKGIGEMSQLRFKKNSLTQKEFRNLMSGPGKLCIAMNLTKKDDGTNLNEDEIFVCRNVDDSSPIPVVETTRIGIQKGKEFDWRFYIKDSEFISKP